MTTILTLALLNKSGDVESIKERILLAKQNRVEEEIKDFGQPAIDVLLEDSTGESRALGIAEISAGRNVWLGTLRAEGVGGVKDVRLGQIARRSGKVVSMRMRVIGPERR